MTFKAIPGGFQLSEEDSAVLVKQRAITKHINDRFVQVGAIFLKASSKNPFNEDDWFKTQYRETNLQDWIDDPELRNHNVGFNLQAGWLDVDIDAADGTDPEFNRCIVAAMEYLGIDCRFKFGRASVGAPSHILLQLGEAEAQNFDYLRRFEPKEFKLGGKRYHVQLRSTPLATDKTKLARSAHQTVMPGSIYTHKSKPGAYDISVWYSNAGIADRSENIAATTPRKTNFMDIIRAIAFGVVLYVIRDEWVEGSRQITAHKLTGWLARVVADSIAMNNHEVLSTEVFCPIDSDSVAEGLIRFVCEQQGDEEHHMRLRAYFDARNKLERNPDAMVPGWPAMEQLVGSEKLMALRAVLMPGSDVSVLSQIAERYLYDESDNNYIDRLRFFTDSSYIHAGEQLERRHRGDVIRVGGKPREAFKVFETSNLRKRVGKRDLYPDLPPGSVNRINALGKVVAEDDEDDDPTILPTFNTWKGWPITPARDVNEALMADLIERLDRLLSMLTSDNKDQIEWAKKWIAWTFQHPAYKQQIAWVIVGDQGVGKSWLGNVFMQAMMVSLWGTASPKVLEGAFSIEPFIDKMFVFIDEAKFHHEAGTDEIKKMVRSVDVPGAEKFGHARNYKIYARLMFASNRFDMNIGQANIKDRALFYTRAYTKEHMSMSETEFREWADQLKPWFLEYTELMKRKDVREHYMRYFMDLPVEITEVESIKYSSSTDKNIITANMSWPRRVAKYIIEDGRIYEDLDITYPFVQADLYRRVAEVCKELGLASVQGGRVLSEFEAAGLLEKVVVKGQNMLRFRYKLGTLTEKFGEAISIDLDPRFEFTEADYGDNDCDGSTRPAWRGAKKGVVSSALF